MSKSAWPKIKTYPRKWQAQGETRTSIGYMIDCHVDGKRYQPKFKTKQDAEQKAKELRARRDALKNIRLREEKNAVRITSLSDTQRTDVLKAFDLLEDGEATITEAVQLMLATKQLLAGTGKNAVDVVRFYMEKIHVEEQITVAELAERYTASKHAAGLAQRTIDDYEWMADRICAQFGDVILPDLNTEEIQGWLLKTENHSYRNKHRHHFVLLLNFAIDRGLIKSNPAKKTVRAKVTESAVEYLDPDQARQLMRVAEASKWADTVVPYFAIALFAGLRPEELNRLDWKDIRLDTSTIQITAKVSKNFARSIEIPANLLEWLLPYRRESGPLAIMRYRKEKITKEAVPDFPYDGARHSFGTYHLALHQNEQKTLFQMGHRKRETFMAHYNGLATKQAAEIYFSIKPSDAGSSQ